MDIVDTLGQAEAYLHPVDAVDLIETHMSWVFLAGNFAYKIKKPVKFDFADFSSLDKRYFFCQEEFRCNRHFNPDLYLAVVPICTMQNGRVQVEPKNYQPENVVEWAVKMNRFDLSTQALVLLDHDELHESTFWDFGHDLGQRHANLPRVHEGYDPARPMLDNFSTLARLTEPELSRMVKRIYGHMQVVLKRLVPLLLARNDDGFVRECHGDLHLGNLMCVNGALQAFDCIEFDPKLRCIDVWADVAFLFMDLSVRGRSDLAYSYIDGYLNSTGDYDGARLLPLLSTYRALVRAKVNTLRYEQCGDASLMEAVIANLNWVEQRQQKNVGKIIITHGLSGSGKSFWAKKLLATFPLIRLRSDVFRKSRFGLEISAKSNSPVAGGIYDLQSTAQVYESLAVLAKSVICSGENVLVDAAFLTASQRNTFRNLAQQCQTDLAIIDFTVPLSVLRDRVRLRLADKEEASEADEKVLYWQVHNREPVLGTGEIIEFDTSDTNVPGLFSSIELFLKSCASSNEL